jgi:hypothetical protein
MSQNSTQTSTPNAPTTTRRAPKIYTESDLKAAEAEVWRLTADQELRGRRPNTYRSALKSALIKVQTIKNSLSKSRPGDQA